MARGSPGESPLRHHTNSKREFGLAPGSLFLEILGRLAQKWLAGLEWTILKVSALTDFDEDFRMMMTALSGGSVLMRDDDVTEKDVRQYRAAVYRRQPVRIHPEDANVVIRSGDNRNPPRFFIDWGDPHGRRKSGAVVSGVDQIRSGRIV